MKEDNYGIDFCNKCLGDLRSGLCEGDKMDGFLYVIKIQEFGAGDCQRNDVYYLCKKCWKEILNQMKVTKESK